VRAMTDAVLFDLGNTLVRYFDRSEFPAILEQAIGRVRDDLADQCLLAVSPEVMWQRVAEENHEAPDHRVRSLEGRLARIFQLDPDRTRLIGEAACRAFLEPIFARGCCYEDSRPVLADLRAGGIKTAIVSNAPWGSPASLWHGELDRLGLSELVDAAVFCGDVGWRKPARPIFEAALQRLGIEPDDALFVGDDPRWDVAGPRAMGMAVLLLDRSGPAPAAGKDTVCGLYELVAGLLPSHEGD
jgi:putative hydrolase of the HAD superfamily